MNAWAPLALAFSAGFAMGVILYGLRLRARLHLYRWFIEERLNSIDLSNLPVRSEAVSQMGDRLRFSHADGPRGRSKAGRRQSVQ